MILLTSTQEAVLLSECMEHAVDNSKPFNVLMAFIKIFYKYTFCHGYVNCPAQFT